MAGGNVTYEVDFAANIARLVAASEGGAKAVQDMAGRIESASNFAKSALETLGVTLSVDYFKDLVAGAIQAEAHMADLATIAGSTAQSFSRFEAPARTSSTAIDTVATAVAKLSQSLGAAQSGALAGDVQKAGLFKALGIDPAQGQDASDVMLEVAKALTSMSDKNAAAYVSSQLLGKSYAELRPFLEEISTATSLTATVTNEQAARAKALTDQYAKMQLQVDLNVRQLAEGMMPSLQDIMTGFTQGRDAGKQFTDLGETLGEFLKGAATLALHFADGIYGLGHAFASAAAAINLAAHGEFSAAVEAWKEGNDDVAAHTKATQDRIDAMWNTSANAALRSAQQQQAAEEAAMNIKTGTGGTDAAVKRQMDFERNYTAMIAAAQAGGKQVADAMKFNNQLLQEAYGQGEIDQMEMIRQTAANDDRALAAKIAALQKEEALAKQKGDAQRAQVAANGIAQAEAERQSAALIARVRMDVARQAEADEDRTYKQNLLKQMKQIEQGNLTKAQIADQSFADQKTILDTALANELISREAHDQQVEELELEHQAALGNITAQGELQRRNLQGMSNQMQLNEVATAGIAMLAAYGTINSRFAKAAQIAGAAQALIAAYAGSAESLKLGWPAGPIAAATILAKGFALVAAIKSASTNTSVDTSPINLSATGSLTTPAATPITGPTIQSMTTSAPKTQPPANITVVLKGKIFDAEQVRELMSQMADQLPYGANITVSQEVT